MCLNEVFSGLGWVLGSGVGGGSHLANISTNLSPGEDLLVVLLAGIAVSTARPEVWVFVYGGRGVRHNVS